MSLSVVSKSFERIWIFRASWVVVALLPRLSGYCCWPLEVGAS